VFEFASQAKKQILRDKHTLLEGYVTEQLFESQFLEAKPHNYTNGWWSAEAAGTRFFFVVTNKLSDLDCAIMKRLSKQYPCWRAYPRWNTWYFYNGNRKLSMDQFTRQYHLNKTGSYKSATNETRDEERQKRCLEFFQQQKTLQKIAIERHFADFFLTNYFRSLVNIDFFVLRNNGNLSAIEVKFKFESFKGKFGINDGQFKLFELLEQAGIEIQHWILYNWTHDKDLSIFGFLELDSEDKYWLQGRIDTSSSRSRKIAPEETSVYGLKRQPYYEFDKSEFAYAEPLVYDKQATKKRK
jgi:hypothetical protein